MYPSSQQLKTEGIDRTSECAIGAVAVTPNDLTDIPTTRGLYLGGGGNLAVIMSNGDAVTFIAMQAGVPIPYSVKRVKATGTTATNIIATY